MEDRRMSDQGGQVRVFKIPCNSGNRYLQKLFSLAEPTLEKLLAFDQVNTTYERLHTRPLNSHFVHETLRELNIRYEIGEKDFYRIPQSGPVITVSNHPFGGIDGIILCSILLSARPDVKVMVNYLLNTMEELRDIFIYVDPFQAEHSLRSNIRPTKEALSWLRRGGLLSVFPSGEVSHVDMRKMEVIDPPWMTGLARLIRASGASVLPVFFKGRNSLLFQSMGLVHPRLRTAMLPREIMNKRNKTVRVRIGGLIPHQKLARFESDEELMKYLRVRTYMLDHYRDSRRDARRNVRRGGRAEPQRRFVQPVVPPEKTELLVRELESLPPEQILIRTDKISVVQGKAEQIPHILQEIGRLREITFRREGEGTGKSIDLDRYDQDYVHVFLWNNQKQEIMGAYRLGQTDVVTAKRGVEGLYTHTLFDYGRAFLDRIDPALEVGRSWVRYEYQRTYQPLLLLWKGIGQFVARNPQYRMLFGPVSLNRYYLNTSRQLIVNFLRLNLRQTDLSRLVRPRNPLRGRRLRRRWKIKDACSLLQDIQDLSDVVSDIEKDQKGIPILFKQYVKLGGKFLGFNLDPDFGDVLDGLILVDLVETDRKTLTHYMGKEDADAFLRYHRKTQEDPLAVSA
jgi:putative hemolysin